MLKQLYKRFLDGITVARQTSYPFVRGSQILFNNVSQVQLTHNQNTSKVIVNVFSNNIKINADIIVVDSNNLNINFNTNMSGFANIIFFG